MSFQFDSPKYGSNSVNTDNKIYVESQIRTQDHRTAGTSCFDDSSAL